MGRASAWISSTVVLCTHTAATLALAVRERLSDGIPEPSPVPAQGLRADGASTAEPRGSKYLKALERGANEAETATGQPGNETARRRRGSGDLVGTARVIMTD